MTEGTIQKVFKKYEHPLYFYGYKNDVEQLKQELIEEIKKEFPKSFDKYGEPDPFSTNYNIVRKRLIGDNE